VREKRRTNVYACKEREKERGERIYMSVKREKGSMLSMNIPKSSILFYDRNLCCRRYLFFHVAVAGKIKIQENFKLF